MIKALIGNGGHAREVMSQIGEELPRFVDDEYYIDEKNVYPMSKFDPNKYEIMIAIGNSYDRYNISLKMPKETKYFSFIHPTSLIMKNCKIGMGSFIGAYSIVTCDVTIGNHSLLNRYINIGHDSIIGDYFSAMPGSVISGFCKIGNRVYLGNNSSIREKIEICNDVTIGMNSCVIKNINKNGIYAGVPIKLKR